MKEKVPGYIVPPHITVCSPVIAFRGLDIAVFIKAIAVLESQKKAKLYQEDGVNREEWGVKFF